MFPPGELPSYAPTPPAYDDPSPTTARDDDDARALDLGFGETGARSDRRERRSSLLPVLLLLALLLGGGYFLSTLLLGGDDDDELATPPVRRPSASAPATTAPAASAPTGSGTSAAGGPYTAEQIAASLKDPHFKHGYDAGVRRAKAGPVSDAEQTCRAMGLQERTKGYPWGAQDRQGCLVGLGA